MFLSSIDFIVKKSPDFFLAGLSVSFVSSLFLEALTSLPKRKKDCTLKAITPITPTQTR